jgi:hypothetical protein
LGGNRFQRFLALETAEAVATSRRLGSTPLKRGVNQSMAAKEFRRAQKVRCAPRCGIGNSTLETDGISVYIASVEMSNLEVKIPDLLLKQVNELP